MEQNFGKQAVLHMADRQSCRNFTSQPIPDDVLQLILQAGLKAATGGNLQPYSILVERDKARNEELCRLCGNQPFIKNAAVNLIFLLDWHKYSIYAKQKNAPFFNSKIYMHYLIAVEDVLCAAQTIETAAHMMGIGSCYVGSSNSAGLQITQMYNAPKLTFPIVVLSLGYPDKMPPKAPKMPYGMMVFESKYPDFTPEQIYAGFEAKYAGKILELPKTAEHMEERLGEFRAALLTTYPEAQADAIVDQARKDGFINETQRRFGLHYQANKMYEGGREILKAMAEQGLLPFDAITKE